MNGFVVVVAIACWVVEGVVCVIWEFCCGVIIDVALIVGVVWVLCLRFFCFGLIACVFAILWVVVMVLGLFGFLGCCAW